MPVLVLSDFGCCVADKNHGLRIPYSSSEMDKGGNTALMAPEVILKQPGMLSTLNYTKSDLWACGSIAYEIFGQPNPFYYANNVANAKPALKNVDYNEAELPEMPSEVPLIVKKLVENMLQRNPSKVMLSIYFLELIFLK